MAYHEVVTVVYKTDDYNIFNYSDGNRNIVVSKNLIDEAEKGIVSPIIVNEDYTVIDGQHRLEAIKKVGKEVEFIIKPGLNEEDIKRMNISQKSWNLLNYIESYANAGNQEYKKLVELLNENHAPITAVMSISMDYPSRNAVNGFVKSGKFKFNNYDETVKFFNYYNEFRRRTKTPKRDLVIQSIYTLYRVEKFNKKRMIEKIIETSSEEIVTLKKTGLSDMTKFLIDVYNKNIPQNANNFIKYHIDHTGKVIIDENKKGWVRK